MKMLNKKPLIIGIGELLWDVFPDNKYLGGAAANFVFHANQLGSRTNLISRVGSDQPGSQALDQYSAMGQDTSQIQIDQNHPTGTVNIALDKYGNPDFEIVENAAWDYITFERQMSSLAYNADLLYFGSLSQRAKTSRDSVLKLIASVSEATLKFFDVNLRNGFYSREIIINSLKAADIVKVNEEEYEIIIDMAKPSKRKASYPVNDFLKDYKIEMLCITLGERGCQLITANETVIDKAREVIVKDTVGAGDAFSAALAVNFLAGKDIRKIAQAANIMGGFVASHKGACPEINYKIYEQVGLNF